MKLDFVVPDFALPPSVLAEVLLPKVGRHIEASLVLQAHHRVVIDLSAQVLNSGAHLLSSLTSILDFESRHFRSEVFIKPEVEPESQVVEAETSTGQPASLRLVEVSLLALAQITVQSVCVFVHLFLTLDVRHALGSFPPLRRGLHYHSVWLQFFDQFFGAGRQQSRLVARAYQVDILAIEAFSQVEQGRGEARFSKRNFRETLRQLTCRRCARVGSFPSLRRA